MLTTFIDKANSPLHLPDSDAPSTNPFIKIHLKTFLRCLLNSNHNFIDDKTNYNLQDNIKISSELALLIKALDPSETFVHLEFPSDENKLDYPIIWEITAWKSSYARRVKQQAASEKSSKENALRNEKIRLLTIKVMEETGFDKEASEALALHLVMKHKVKDCMLQYGVDISMLNREENAKTTFVNNVW